MLKRNTSGPSFFQEGQKCHLWETMSLFAGVEYKKSSLRIYSSFICKRQIDFSQTELHLSNERLLCPIGPHFNEKMVIGFTENVTIVS